MKLIEKVEKTYVLEMSEQQRKWLKDYLQNSFDTDEQPYDTNHTNHRNDFFEALSIIK